jgi:hypothetical protein
MAQSHKDEEELLLFGLQDRIDTLEKHFQNFCQRGKVRSRCCLRDKLRLLHCLTSIAAMLAFTNPLATSILPLRLCFLTSICQHTTLTTSLTGLAQGAQTS